MNKAVLVMVFLVVACGAGGVGTTTDPQPSDSPVVTSTPSAAAATESPTSLPLDPSIVPVSRSHPSPDAAAAMDVCAVATFGLDKIGGMGLIAEAADAKRYAPMSGLEPELMSSRPAWMIQLSGEVPQPRPVGEVWIDPVCIVIDGRGGFYATGPVRLADGSLYTPAPAPIPPVFRLPPLAP